MLRSTVKSQSGKVQFAKGLRQRQTEGERVLWKKLRASRFRGYKFRRQVPIGPFIADFLCVAHKLIIEIDGDSHFQPGAQERDRQRTVYLESLGFTVLRFTHRYTIDQTEDVLTEIGAFLASRECPSPCPSPKGEGTPLS